MTRSCRKNNRTERPKTKEHCCSGLRGSLPWCYPVVPRGTPWYPVVPRGPGSPSAWHRLSRRHNGEMFHHFGATLRMSRMSICSILSGFQSSPRSQTFVSASSSKKNTKQKGHKKQKMTNVANYFSNTTALAESLVVFWLLMACEVIFQKNIGWGL